ncbi:oligosaccharide flippase family protein [Listeria booriae]|uniref:Oligosaccharide flippase family protein n=1 Tax=Listeria booriae TaxID=1552123 RepID=A0A7X0XIB0_9LIST|nr:polysaccharide biosynthesis C-terminal domain-containing protein [Listeria booriae]MBC1561545.1 oligosaccharide flippase family protein [Listeria booriae]MBC2321750.1 oligosaccharide flippase family protein [Listeria booriae]MCD2205759.1 polysaccharide biosynthesis C-terminal domain-containing protein [Listeria booriae]
MQPIKKVLSSSYGMTLLKKIIIIFTGLLSIIFMTRYLGPTLKGEYAYYMNAVNIGVSVLNMGISLAYVNYKRRETSPHQFEATFITLSLVQYIIYILIAVGMYFIGQSVDYVLVMVLIALNVLSVQLTQINLVESIRKHTMIAISTAVSNCILTIIVYFIAPPYVFIALLVYAAKNLAPIIMTLLTIRPTQKRIRGREQKRIRIAEWPKIMKQGFLPMLVTCLIALNYRMDILFLEWFHISSFNIGLYSTGVQLAEYGWMLPDIFKEVMMNKNAKKDAIASLAFSIRMAMTLVILFILFMALFGKYIIIFLFGTAFEGAYFTTLLMFLAIPFIIYSKIIGTLFIAQGKMGFYLATLIISVVLNAGLNIALIPYWGIVGSAIASILSYTICGLMCVLWLKQKYKIKWKQLTIMIPSDSRRIREYLKKN